MPIVYNVEFQTNFGAGVIAECWAAPFFIDFYSILIICELFSIKNLFCKLSGRLSLRPLG